MIDSITVLSEHELGDMVAHYVTDTEGRVGLWLYPASERHRLADRRATMAGESWVRRPSQDRPAIGVESLVHVAITGDDQAGQFGPGRTMMWSPSIDRFRLDSQHREGETIVTVLRDDSGLVIQHRLSAGYRGLTIRSEVTFSNESAVPVRLELLTSFAISGITPFAVDDAPGRLLAHRFRSVWSAEGRMVSDSIEHLHLERSWAGDMKFSERFGQVGSMPVRGWFPSALVEDTEAGVVWGARLAIPTSWQLEIGRRSDDLTLSGGLADHEFGHWAKTIAPGESFTTPSAWVTCVAGTVDDACDRLLSIDIPAIEAKPDVERDLPIIYNDWCTSWGEPQEQQLLAIADRLAPLDVRYLVIDAGWYMPVGAAAHWSTSLGDWQADASRFPDGLAATAARIRDRGMIPGLWMEPEHVAKDAESFSETDHLYTRYGKPLTLGVRRGWNMNDPFVTAYIDERVIALMRDADFGYLKIDYSESLGLGVDHVDGLGEGLRRHGEGTHAMFDRITAALPDLVIEICSAGGHRMESSLLQRTSMTSFSDAHETIEIPIVAAALHRLVQPRQSQIWAVLHHEDSPVRFDYSLAATFLGRMCLSGDILELDDSQLAQVATATEFYRKAAPVIRDGSSRLSGELGSSWRHPTGWQAVVRTSGDRGLVVVHTFADSPRILDVTLPGEGWRISDTLTPLPVGSVDGGLQITGCEDFSSQVVLIERHPTRRITQ
jgi:alpha-galactosidase